MFKQEKCIHLTP